MTSVMGYITRIHGSGRKTHPVPLIIIYTLTRWETFDSRITDDLVRFSLAFGKILNRKSKDSKTSFIRRSTLTQPMRCSEDSRRHMIDMCTIHCVKYFTSGTALEAQEADSQL